jgi:hypothetical protein
VARAAVLALARCELRRSWRTLVVLGLLAGLSAGVALAALAAAHRTTSAHDRLLAATGLDDARVMLMGRPEAAGQVAALPGVAASWTAGATVAQVRAAQVHFVAITSGPPKPPGLFTPVVVAGREPGDGAPLEVTVTEALAGHLDLAPGDRLPLKLLAPEEVYAFDTGFGEPDGPAVDLQVVGVVRVASAGNEGTGPVYAGPAFARDMAPWVAGASQLVRLEPGGRAAFEAGLAALSEASAASKATAEFGPLRPIYPERRTDPQVATAERVLGTALVVLALLAAGTGALATAQGFARLAAAGGPAQRTESALGLVTRERVAARTLPALLAAATAGALAGGVALLGGLVEPLGQLARYEPSPGWAPDVTVALLGAAGTAAVVLGVAAGCAWSAGRGRSPGGEPAPLHLPRVLRGPVLMVGARFALAPGRERGPGGSTVPVRTTTVGVVLGVAGLVATATFAASLAVVERSPATYGWTAHFSLVDAKEQEVGRLVADPQVADVDLVDEASVALDGTSTAAFAVERRKGALPWAVVEGRLPRAPGEVALGPHLARRLGLGQGDAVAVGDRTARVTGVVQAPALTGQRLGDHALLTPAGLAGVAEAQPLRNALVRVAGDPDAVYARYAADLELTPAGPPAEVDNLADLGRLPALLMGLLALVGAVALGHALVLTGRRRTRDLGVLRALGLTPRQVSGTLLSMAGTTVVLGLLLGVPLGLAVGRVAWAETTGALGLVSGVEVPGAALAVLVPATLVVALLVAAVPARAAARLSPAAALRAE